MVFVRARRSATIRTRSDADFVRAQLTDLAASPEPEGWDRVKAHGYFKSGWVGQRDFHFEYYFNNPKNPHTFDVEGRIVEEPEWRVLRVKLTSQEPWLDRWMLLGMVGMSLFYVFFDDFTVVGMVFLLLFVLLVMLIANFFYIPDVVARRVAALLASEVRGSVKVGSAWVVPERE
ncbi:MAG TPA: hypothetical protein VFM29_09485 [Vicinamibacteria bacterium]|nr:hypothetical protein [Vicinamibacteria bacterium]